LKTAQFLSLHGTRKTKDPNKYKKSVSENFFDGNLVKNCFAITDLLSQKYDHHPFSIASKQTNSLGEIKSIIPTGLLLLQTIAQSLHCAFLVFSTRSQSLRIKPYLSDTERLDNMRNRKPMPLYLILHHVDSFIP
jgi:hypothetical protein